MNRKHLKNVLLSLPLAIVLIGCETTSYQYTPPTSPGSAKCIRKCLELKEYSVQNCEYNERRCKDRLLWNGKSDTENFHDRFQCEVEKKNCLERVQNEYHQCYEGCGGTVKTITKKN